MFESVFSLFTGERNENLIYLGGLVQRELRTVNGYNSSGYSGLISCYLFYSMEFKVILKTKEISLPCYLIHNWEGKKWISSFLKVICAKRNAAAQAKI